MSTTDRFRSLFRGLADAHGQYTVLAGGKKRVKTVREAPPDEAWENHLAGQGPFLGIVPITADSTCYFGALDVDDEAIDHRGLVRLVEKRNLPLVVCRSKSGGAHLYVFFVEPVPAREVVSKLKRWQAALGVTNPDGRPVEIFPKQTVLHEKGVGNWINLPYYGADDTDRYAFSPNGRKLSLSGFLDLAEKRLVTLAQLKAREPTFEPGDEKYFFDGPPCLQRMLELEEGFSAGTRNQALYNVGIYLKIRYPDAWDTKLEEFNEAVIDPPLDAGEVATVTQSLARRDYAFKCDDAPIVHFCDKKTCLTRRWGIGFFQEKSKEEKLPTLSDLVRFHTDPPYYTIEVDGKKVKLEWNELFYFKYFCEQVFKQTGILVSPIKQPHWHRILSEDLIPEIREVQPPRDAGIQGQFLQLVNEFLSLHRTSESRESLILGKPFRENGKIFFRSRDLLDFIDRRRFRWVNSPKDVWRVLMTLGVGSTTFTVKNREVNCWWLEDSREPDGSLELPTVSTSQPEF